MSIPKVRRIQMDWTETPEAHVFKPDLPGINKEEIMVELEAGKFLLVRAERNMKKLGCNDPWHMAERKSGKFKRRIQLPDNAQAYELKASLENGVLTINIPKKDDE